MRWLYIVGTASIVGTLAAPWLSWEDYRFAANVSLAFLAAITVIFAFRYIGWSRWHKNKIGRVFALCTILLSLTLVQGAVSVWWPAAVSSGKEYVRFTIYSGGVIGMGGMLCSLWLQQRRDRNEKKKWLSSGSDPMEPK